MGNLLGTKSNTGMGWQAAPVNLDRAVDLSQTKQAYDTSQQALQAQKAFMDALQAQNGIQNQSNVFNQYAALASGQGPSLAQAQLNQATGANVANQAALAAGQRGAAQNVGMIARQAGNVGANAQQQAASQAAQLRAAEQLSAMNQMGNIAGQQVGQQAGATQFYNQAAQNEQQNLLNAVAQYNQAQVGSQESMNRANAQLQSGVAQGQSGLVSNIFNAAGMGGAKAMGATGGEVKPDQVGHNPQSVIAEPDNDSFLLSWTQGPKPHPANMAHGGKVPAILSPGEVYVPPRKVKEVAKGKDPRAVGEQIKGKAKVKGDSLKNDTVPKDLDEGGFVIPRSVMQSKDPAKEAAKFVQAHLASSGYGLRKSKKDK